MKKQQAFTLIEVLIVIFILGILAITVSSKSDESNQSSTQEARVITAECEDGELVAYVDDERVVIGSNTRCEEQNQSSNSSWSN